jgi:hypothetical protein
VKRVIVPIDLGGSATGCALVTEQRPAQEPEVIRALVDRYSAERLVPGAQLEVGFFRGGIPSEALLAAAAPHPIRVSTTPADLAPDRIAWLKERGVRTLELEVCTFHDPVLWGLRRGYDSAFARLLAAAARGAGLELGLVLVPGLPGHTPEAALDDARAATVADFVRIYPALAFEHSDLARWAEQGRWRPAELEDAVHLVVDMVEIVEARGTAVARIGFQPGPDGPDKVVAGPHHPNLRGLVESQRFRRRMERLFVDPPTKQRIVLRVNPKDLSWAKGTSNENVRWLRQRLAVEDIDLESDETLERGSLAIGSGPARKVLPED